MLGRVCLLWFSKLVRVLVYTSPKGVQALTSMCLFHIIDRRASCCLHLHCHDRRVRLRLQRRTACSQLTNCILQPRARCMACAQPVRRSSICLLRRLLPRTHLPNPHEPLRSGYPAGPDFWCHWLDCLLGRGRCRCVSFHHRCHRVKGRHREPVACVSTVSSCAEIFH